MKRLLAAGSAMPLIVALAACGDRGYGGEDSRSGTTIRIVQIAPYSSPTASLPFMKTSAQAAVDELNAAGGVNGYKVVLTTCDSKYDPNEELRCAQEAVREKAVAVVGGLMVNGAQTLALLEKAEIPSIGADAITPADAKSPASFLFDAGLPGYAAMPAVAREKLGATKVATFNIESPSVETNNEFFKMGADLAGVEIVSDVVAPLDALDYTQYVERAERDGAEAIITAASPEATLKLFKSLDTTGSKLHVVASASGVTPDTVRQAGAVAEGSWLAQGTPNASEDNEWGAAYVAAMQKYQPDEKVYAGVGLRAYWAVRLFADVAKGERGPLTGPSVWKAFDEVSGLKFAWVDDLDFTQPGPVSALPRVVSPKVFVMQIVDGQFVASGDVDPFE